MGAQAYIDSMKLWAEVPADPTRALAASASWLTKMTSMMATRRQWALELTLAALRLRRALLTGYTFAYDDEHHEQRVSLGQLRGEFTGLVKRYAPDALKDGVEVPHGNAPGKPSRAPSSPSQREDGREVVHDPDGSQIDAYAPERDADDTDITVERLPHLDESLDHEERRSAQEAHDIFDGIGPKRLALRLKGAKDAEAEHDKVGRGVASHAERLTLNGGRHPEVNMGVIDSRAQGWARIHYPHNDAVPCGFCAMLMSRGAIYKSKSSAGGVPSQLGEFDSYHTGDHCRAIALYVGQDYEAEPAFETNRLLTKFWRSGHWRDMGGDTDLHNWSRWFAKFAKEHQASDSDNWEKHLSSTMNDIKAASR